MAVIDSLLITLGLDPTGVNKGMSEAEDRMQSGVQNITQNILAPLMGIFAVGGLINSYLSGADAVGKLSDSLGIDVEAMQAWGEAATRAGGNAEGFQQSLTSLNEKIVEFATSGEGEGKAVFEALGIAAKDASGKALGSLDVLLALAEKAETVEKAKFVGLAQKLGLDQGTIMLLQSGRKAVEELIARQKELGVYSKRDTEVAAAANDALADLGQAFKASAAIILRVVVPAITWLANTFTSFVVFLRQHEPFILAALTAIATILTTRLIPASLKLAAAWLANPMVWIIAAIAAAVIALGLLFDDLFAYITGGNSALADFWSIFGTGEEISKALAEAWDDLQAVGLALWNSMASAVRLFFHAFADVFSGIGMIVRGILRIIKGLFTADFSAMAAGLRSLFQGISTTILGIFTGTFTFARDMWSGFFDWFLGLFKTSLPAIGDNLVTMFEHAITAIKSTLFSGLRAIANNISQVIIGIKDTVFSGLGMVARGILQVFKGLFTANFPAMVAGVISVFQGIGTVVRGVFTTVLDFVCTLWSGFFTWLLGLFGGNLPVITDAIITAFNQAISVVRNMFSALIENITGWIKGLVDKIPSIDGIKSAAGNAWDWAASSLGFSDNATASRASDASRVSTISTQNKTSTINTTATTNVGTINVQTQASNPAGIAGSISGELGRAQERNLVMAAQTGTVTK